MDHQKIKELQDMKQKDWRNKLFFADVESRAKL